LNGDGKFDVFFEPAVDVLDSPEQALGTGKTADWGE
jgi:hypothetical protein